MGKQKWTVWLQDCVCIGLTKSRLGRGVNLDYPLDQMNGKQQRPLSKAICFSDEMIRSCIFVLDRKHNIASLLYQQHKENMYTRFNH